LVRTIADARQQRRSVRRGGITKAGSTHARRVLIEGAWTYRMQARVSRKLLDRLERLPQAVRDIAWRAQLRLCHRYCRLAAAGKPKVVVTTAIAREMVGFIWTIARIVQPRPASGNWTRKQMRPLRKRGLPVPKRLAGGGPGGESSSPVRSRPPADARP
jgi:hypothetical protein